MMTTKRFYQALGMMLLMVLAAPAAWAQLGKVSGTLMDQGSPLPYTNIKLMDGTTIVGQTMSDLEGKYSFAKIEPGTYQIVVTSGEITRPFGLVISPGENEFKDLALTVETNNNVIQDSKEIFTTDPQQFVTITRKEIGMMPTTRNTSDLIGALPGVTQKDHGDPMNLRGGRSGATVTFVDGQKVSGALQMPQAAINQVTLISGGVPAEFGDVTGGIVLISSYNPGMKGFAGKPLTKAERKAFRKKRKQSGKSSQLPLEDQIYALNI